MSNWIDLKLDALAPSPGEINNIEAALQEPSEESLTRVAKWEGADPSEIAPNLKDLVAFRLTRNLFRSEPSAARRFENSFKDRCYGIIWSHVYSVSEKFPASIFLAEYRNTQVSSAGKRVIRAGREVRCSYDSNQQAQGYDWVLLDIFLPYQAEYDLGLEFGSLWDLWMADMQTELSGLKAFYDKCELENRSREP